MNNKGRELSDSERAFIAIDEMYPKITEYYEKREAILAALKAEHGVDHSFQGPDGRVHLTVVPEWKQTRMEHFGVISTARKAGDRNDLSVKRATELGFEVPALPKE